MAYKSKELGEFDMVDKAAVGRHGKKNTARQLTAAAFLILSVYLIGRFGGVIFPFAAAYIAARIFRPAGVYISKKCRIPEKAGCAAFALLMCFALFFTAGTLSGMLLSQLSEIMARLPEYIDDASRLISGIYDMLPSRISRGLSGNGHLLPNAVNEVFSALTGFASEFIKSVPGGVFSTFAGLLAFIYLTADPIGAADSLRSLMPEELFLKVSNVFREIDGALLLYLRNAVIILFVTFAELFVGLSIIGSPYPAALALIIAIIDALPVLGCGTVLVPWALFELIYGSLPTAIGLLILLIVLYIVRQILDTRLIGKMTGVHPFIALMGLYIGWSIGGIYGMLAAPLLLSCIQSCGKNRAQDVI